MEDLLKITKNYYQKTESEKQVVKNRIYADLLQIVQDENLGYIDFMSLTDNYVKAMIQREDYEIADLVNTLSKDLIKNYYGIK